MSEDPEQRLVLGLLTPASLVTSVPETSFVGYDSIRAMIEMGIVYELVLPNRRKQSTVLISYDEQATSNTLSHVQTP